MEKYLPYIIAVLSSIITGVISYFYAITKSKIESNAEMAKIKEQHKLDLENQKEFLD